tara:strand:- start:2097 stop:3551 length:1455 start_codon:yes stop_codon:yes gene_type:complete
MARKQTLDAIISLYKKLGGNTSEVLGTKTNVNFLGKGKSPELMLDMDINADALGVLPRSKAVEELTSSVGYAVSGKLNDIQASQLLKNMQTMDNVYFPPAAPANITDLQTGIRNLDQEGLMSLRAEEKLADDLVKNVSDAELEIRGRFPKASDVEIKKMLDKPSKEIMDILDAEGIDLPEGVDPRDTILPSRPIDEVQEFTKSKEDVVQDLVDRKFGKGYFDTVDDVPPPGSRGGPEDIAAPFTGAGLEAIKNVKGSNLIVDDIVNKIYLNAGVAENAQPVVRANAREFLNRIKDLEDPEFPSGTTLSSIMEPSDFKFMTEGGGGGMGDPFLLVQKYFGPKVASSVAKLDSPDDIQKFAENLVKVKDARGNTITSRYFDPDTVDDFEFADGGRVPMFMGGAARMGFQALRRYGFEAKDITRMFKELAVDKSLVGKEKTLYFQTLNKALKNPEEFPDTIKEMQLKLGIDVGTGFKSGGLAGILEV